MFDEVQIVSGCDGHNAGPSFAQAGVSLVECLVNVDKSIHSGLPVSGRLIQLHVHRGENLRTDILEEVDENA